jgi:hypothetical protein
VGILVLVNDASVLKLDVEVLVDRVERPTDGQIVFKLHRHLLPHELLEVGEEQLYTKTKTVVTNCTALLLLTTCRGACTRNRETICLQEKNYHGGLRTLAAIGSAEPAEVCNDNKNKN